MIDIFILIIIVLVILFIFLNIYASKKKKKKILVNEIIFSGLCNRLFGISSSYVLSELSNRKLLCISLI